MVNLATYKTEIKTEWCVITIVSTHRSKFLKLEEDLLKYLTGGED